MNFAWLKLDLMIPVVIIILLVFMIYNNRKTNLAEKETSSRLGVQELIEKVRSELIEAGKKRAESGEISLFEIKDFELELNFVVKETNSEKGGFEFKAVTVSNGSEYSSEKIQKIKLRMTAVEPQKQQVSPAKQTDNQSSEKPEILNIPLIPKK